MGHASSFYLVNQRKIEMQKKSTLSCSKTVILLMSDNWDERVNLRLQKFTSTCRRRWSIFSKRAKPSEQKSRYMGRDIFSIFFVQIDAPMVLQLS